MFFDFFPDYHQTGEHLFQKVTVAYFSIGHTGNMYLEEGS